MKQENAANRPAQNSLSRREFLAASAALVAVVAFDGEIALAQARDSGSLSAASFEDARRRAIDLVARMTLEEAVGQMGNNSPALPHLNLARYNYWTEALHGVVAPGPITSFPSQLRLAVRGIPIWFIESILRFPTKRALIT